MIIYIMYWLMIAQDPGNLLPYLVGGAYPRQQVSHYFSVQILSFFLSHLVLKLHFPRGKGCESRADFPVLFTQGDKSVRVMRSLLAAQQTFVDRLVHLMKAVQRESGNRKKKASHVVASCLLLKVASHPKIPSFDCCLAGLAYCTHSHCLLPF